MASATPVTAVHSPIARGTRSGGKFVTINASVAGIISAAPAP